MPSISLIIIFVVLIILNCVAYAGAGLVYTRVQSCQNNESVYCPGLYCAMNDDVCGHNAFRVNSKGQKVCQKYLISQAAPTVTTKAKESNV